MRGLYVTNARQVWILGFVGSLIAAVRRGLLGSGIRGVLYRQPVPLRLALTTVNVPEKSVAVLPFENLSTEKENAFFTNGVQDEILTNLAKVADLKVISHWSVQAI